MMPKGQPKTTVRQKAIWLCDRPDLCRIISEAIVPHSGYKYGYARRIQHPDDWKYVVSELKKAGLVAPSTYWKDMHLIEEHALIQEMLAERTLVSNQLHSESEPTVPPSHPSNIDQPLTSVQIPV